MDGSSFLASFAAEHEIRFGAGSLDTFPVSGEKVTILPSADKHEVGSSKMKITNIINYVWKHEYHPGQLIAVHRAGAFIAYGVLATGKNIGVVRVVQRQTEERVLLKGMRGKVRDLAFSHSSNQIILGVVDEFANLFVYRIEENSSDRSLKTETLMQINAEANANSKADLKYLRLIWCPYLPDDHGEDDVDDEAAGDDSASRLLVVTRNTVADVFNLDMVTSEYGHGELDSANVIVGRFKIDDHLGPITDASFSPDGTAIATVSEDGQVKFFQMYKYSEYDSPRCLHQWSPHDGKPVSSLFFLDNHLNYNPGDQFWKYAVTGANHNTEFKIWDCSSWTCLQTVTFLPPPMTSPSTSSSPLPSILQFKAALDLSAKYLLLSDIYRNFLYVLRLEEVREGGISRSVSFASISAFPTPSAFLSMAIFEAGTMQKSSTGRRKKLTDSDEDSASSDSESDDDEAVNGEMDDSESTCIQFLFVQPKSLQECRIVYEDAHQMASSKKSFVDSLLSPKDIKPSLASLSLALSSTISPAKSGSNLDHPINKRLSGLNGGGSGDLQTAAEKITLISPDAFDTKIKKEPLEEQSNTMSTPSGAPMRGATTLNYLPTARQIFVGTSGTSSPSREVADILGTGEGDDEIDLNVEYVVTEEHDDDDEEDCMEDSDDDEEDVNVFDEIALKKEEEEFANLDKILMNQKIKMELETDDDDDNQRDHDDDEDDDDDEGVDPLETSMNNLRIKQEILSTSTSSSGVQIKQESLYASPGCSASIVKLEPMGSPIMTSSLTSIKQEMDHPTIPTSASISSAATFLPPPPPVSLLSRSFDLNAPATSAAEHLAFQHNQQMSLVMKKLGDMASLIQTQRAEIQVLRQEVRALHSQDQQQMETLIKTSLASQAESLSKRAGMVAGSPDTKVMVASITQAVHNSLGGHLEREVKSIAPFIAQIAADSISQNLNKEVKVRLSRADEQLRSAILKMSQSKPAMEAMGQALAASLHPILQSAFREMFASILVPAFERSSQNLLEGMRTVINKGYKEYEAQLRHHVYKQMEPITKELKDNVAKIVSSVAQQQQQSVNVDKQLKEMQRKLITAIQDLVANEMREAVQNVSLSRSMSATPTLNSSGQLVAGQGQGTPVKDPHTAVSLFLSQSKWNQAFSTALMANNLDLVVATCEQVDPAVLFNQPECPLTQNVLLSLIQQLSNKLEDKTEVKIRYLENAVINLDMTKSTRIHVGGIATRLCEQLKLFMMTHPDSPVSRKIKVLLMATSALITDK